MKPICIFIFYVINLVYADLAQPEPGNEIARKRNVSDKGNEVYNNTNSAS